MKRNSKLDSVVKLNTNQIRRAVRSIYLNSFDGQRWDEINLSEIRISDSTFKTFIRGKCVLYFDRHCHYPDVCDHQTAVYLYLRALEQVLSNPLKLLE